MHTNKQNQKNSESQITSFDRTTLDPVEMVQLEEMNVNIGRTISCIGVVSLCVSALALASCLADADGEVFEEDVGEVEQAIGSECAGAFPTATFISVIEYMSPQTYNTASCYKGVVVDVSNYASTKPFGHDAFTGAGWADSVPLASDSNHVSDCNNLWVQGDLFELGANGSWIYRTSRERKGSWNSDPNAWFYNTCSPPGVAFSDLMRTGKSYRISATARTSKSSYAPTRKVRVLTSFIEIPR